MIASFDIVNYSLRPSKSIQRQIVFDGVRTLQSHLDLKRMVYVGLGSIWFTDFIMAHKLLGISDMVSIERSEIGHRRAVFNIPYATVRVCLGYSSQVLPTLYDDQIIRERPWMIWLDYDGYFDETLRDDIRSVIEQAPENTIFLITFNGKDRKYGHANDRPQRLRELFGDVVPDELPKHECGGDRMQETLADLAIDFMKSVAAELTHPGGFVPAFRLIYKDTAAMVTVGGLMPTVENARDTTNIVGGANWKCRPEKRIVAPHLTIREAVTLQSQLPSAKGLSRSLVQSLGFDLEDGQIEAFEKYYREYPAFAQIIT